VVHTDAIIDTSTQKMVSHTVVHQSRFCTWPTLKGAHHFIITTTVLSFTRAQKIVIHTVAHYRIMFAHVQHGEEQNTLTVFLPFCILRVHTFPIHFFTTQKQ